MGEQKLADSATAHVGVVRARARAAHSAPGVGCESGFRRVLSQRPARAPFPPPQDANLLPLVMRRYATASRAWMGATGHVGGGSSV
jgi:hypothetical protein